MSPSDIGSYIRNECFYRNPKGNEFQNIIMNVVWRNVYHIRFHHIISKSYDDIDKEKISYDFDSYIACVTLYKMGAVPMANREKCLVELSAVMTCITSWQVGKISKKKLYSQI